jgi:hypothetical protein
MAETIYSLIYAPLEGAWTLKRTHFMERSLVLYFFLVVVLLSKRIG